MNYFVADNNNLCYKTGEIEIIKTIQPFLAEKQYNYEKEFCELGLSIPIRIANAHTKRFDDPVKAMDILNGVMSNCNNMIVYLEQIKEIYTDKPAVSAEGNAGLTESNQD